MSMMSKRIRAEAKPIEPPPFEPKIHGSAELRAMMKIPESVLDGRGNVIIGKLLEGERISYPFYEDAEEYLKLYGVHSEDDWHDQLDTRKDLNKT